MNSREFKKYVLKLAAEERSSEPDARDEYTKMISKAAADGMSGSRNSYAIDWMRDKYSCIPRTEERGFWFRYPFDFFKRDLVSGAVPLGRKTLGVHPASRPVSYSRLGMQLVNLPENAGIVKAPFEKTPLQATATAENVAVSETSMTLGGQELLGSEIKACGTFARKLISSANEDVVSDLINIINLSAAAEMTRQALVGTGSNGEATGITAHSGVTEKSCTTYSNAIFADILATVCGSGATEDELKCVIEPVDGAQVLRQRQLVANTGVFAIQGGKLGGLIPVFDSPDMTSATLIVGDFSTVFICLYGDPVILLDTFSASSAGKLRIVLFALFDVFIPQANRFVKGTSIS